MLASGKQGDLRVPAAAVDPSPKWGLCAWEVSSPDSALEAPEGHHGKGGSSELVAREGGEVEVKT